MISVIVPFYNEKESLPILIKSLVLELDRLKKEYEIVLVDDGSDKNSKFNIHPPNRRAKFKNLKLLEHKKRKGKGEALKTGVENAKGEILVFMDADLQDDPKDLPKFFEKIDEGYDFVNGYRVNRRDNFLVKIYSKVASWFLKDLSSLPFF
jgi:glycosyltransferase involved in cell wall biosynthesis